MFHKFPINKLKGVFKKLFGYDDGESWKRGYTMSLL